MILKTFSFSTLLFYSMVHVSAQTDLKPQLFKDLEMVCSAKFEGRKTGTIGNKLAREYLIDRFNEIGLQPFQKQFIHGFPIDEGKNLTGNVGYNIVGFLPGSSDEVIVISAHYDHLGVKNGDTYFGCDDNASGVAALLSIASKLKGTVLDKTLIFVAFDAEEQGLLGAYSFVENPPISIERIKLNVNMDMVSKNKENEIFASGTHHTPNLKVFIKEVRDGYPIKIRLGHDRPDAAIKDWTTSSDHAAFHKKGIPYLYFGVEDHGAYHQPTDTFDQTDFEFYLSTVQAITDIILKLDQKDLNQIK
ncbi:MAG: M28 family peptidase [Cyclobacteriaceae bacterium]